MRRSHTVVAHIASCMSFVLLMAALLEPGADSTQAADRSLASIEANLAESILPISALPVAAPDLVAAAAPGPRVVNGRLDANGCPWIDVWRGSRRVHTIRPPTGPCPALGRQMRVAGRVYFEWTTRQPATTPATATSWIRRTRLWVTDGTTDGTGQVLTLRDQRGPTRACASGWGRVARRPIAAAQWCWDPRTGTRLSGRVVVAWGTRVERKPVPAPFGFATAGARWGAPGARIVTTGTDSHGTELWVHDGAMRRVDLRRGPASSDPRGFRTVGPLVYFEATGSGGLATWVTDGTVAGTRRIVGP